MLKEACIKTLERLLLNDKGEFSLTKVGGWVVTLALAVVTAGVCPPVLLPYVKVLAILGGGTALSGARDALNK